MEATQSQIDRTLTDMKRISGDQTLEVEQVVSTLYFFGSELSTLRLLSAFRNSKNANHGYSQPKDTHFFSLEILS